MSIPSVGRDQQTVVILDAGVREPISNLIYQYDFHDRDTDVRTDNIHGSLVASRVAASDPSANIVFFKVSPDNADSVSSTAVTAALNWVIRYAHQLNVAAVNLSFSDGKVVSAPTTSIYSSLFAKLKSLDVGVVVSAGNEGSKTGVSTFASPETVVAVSASDGRQSFASSSNRDADLTDLVALGQNVSFLGNSYNGTSISAPLVSGAISAVKDAFFETYGRETTVAESLLLLQQTGKAMRLAGEVAGTSPGAGKGYVELDLARALAAVNKPDMLASFGLGEHVYQQYAWSDDINGLAGQAYRLYQAAFDRQPDAGGLGYWIDQLQRGTKLETVARGFVGSDEFQSTYGSTVTNDRFIELLYNNVLDRQPDSAGYGFWQDAMQNGLTRESLLIEFSESPENQSNVLAQISGGIQYLPFIT